MKKLKKIKLSNIENSQLEKDQLINLKGGDCGYGDPCVASCHDSCVGVQGYFNHATTNHEDPQYWYWH
jgi:natural product precursor